MSDSQKKRMAEATARLNQRVRQMEAARNDIKVRADIERRRAIYAARTQNQNTTHTTFNR